SMTRGEIFEAESQILSIRNDRAVLAASQIKPTSEATDAFSRRRDQNEISDIFPVRQRVLDPILRCMSSISTASTSMCAILDHRCVASGGREDRLSILCRTDPD